MLLTDIKTLLDKHLTNNCSQIAVAFSGGRDSTVLLHMMSKIKPQYTDIDWTAVHINHGISTNADYWEVRCKKVSERLGFKFLCARHHVVANNRESLEQKAREVRYRSFIELTELHSLILMAHHLNDQTETFLLQLKRGAGIKGLSAMSESLCKNNRTFLRPLLNVNRRDIEAYLIENQLSWIDDESNQDQQFDRNFLRKQVMPILENRWPGIHKSVSRTAENCAEQLALAEEIAAYDLQPVIDNKNRIDLTKVEYLSSARQRNLIRYWIETSECKLPSKALLDEIFESVIGARKDANPKVILSNKEIRRFQNYLYLLPKQNSLSHVILDWEDLTKKKVLPDGLGSIDFASLIDIHPPQSQQQVTIRFSVANQALKFFGRDRKISPNKLMKELKVEPWLRSRTPMIFYDEQLVAIINVGIVEKFHKVGDLNQ